MATASRASIEPLESRIAPASASAGFNVASLNGVNGFQIAGEAAGDESGRSVQSAGDLNGDGMDDLVIGAFRANADAGAAYVVFGSANGFAPKLDLATLDGTIGFKINGAAAGDFLGISVSAAGDVNGDGIDDLIVGATHATGDVADSGAAYVIFGKTTGFAANLNVTELTGANGFKISGESTAAFTGSVGAAGDVNADGIADVIVGASGVNTGAGAAYVIFGSSSTIPADVKLSALTGSDGFKISGATTGDGFGLSVRGTGDINGDTIDDIIVGAPGTDANGSDSGAAYVVLGHTGPFAATLDIASLTGANGFQLIGEQGSIAGQSVSGAGDVNGDGIKDLVIGAPSSSARGAESGAAYVVFGKSTGFAASLELAALNGANGFEIRGEKRGDNAGHSVSGAGDVNGDGIDDLIIGAIRADSNGSESGTTYIVFGTGGRTFASGLDLSTLTGANGFQIAGAAPVDQLGRTVSAAGDFNGDGIADFIVGAPFADVNGEDSGSSYVIYGAPATQVNPSTLLFVEPDGDEVTIKVANGSLLPQNVSRDTDGNIASIDLTHLAASAHALGSKPLNFNLVVKKPFGGAGDGIAKVGLLDATGVGFGKVKLQGNLDRILAGDPSGKVAAKSLSITGNLGGGNGSPQLSRLFGGLTKLSVSGSMQNNSLQIDGKVKVVSIGGDLKAGPGLGMAPLGEMAEFGLDGFIAQGNATPSAVLQAESFGAVRIGGSVKLGGILTTKDLGSVFVKEDFGGALLSEGGVKSVKVMKNLKSADVANLATITARNKLDVLVIGGDVENAEILIGYNRDELPVDADARIGKVTIKGDWKASSIVAGIDDSTNDGFGRNDTVIAGDSTPAVFSSIASIVIKGTASGSAAPGDHFGISAQKIGKVTISGSKLPLTKDTPDNILLDETNGDFRLVEIG
jgi:hypothetical protein